MMSDGLTIHVRMKFQKRGGRKVIVSPTGSTLPTNVPRSNVDGVLVKALARAFRWQKLLDTGAFNTIKEIAAREKIDASYVGDVMRLSLLAPDIVKLVLEGRQTPLLQFETLRKGIPLEWDAQRQSLLSQ